MRPLLFAVPCVFLLAACTSPLPIAMNISSPAFTHNSSIPAQYTCDGANVSPPLAVSGAPQGTQSLVLIHDDPDAPMGTLRQGSEQAWVHWLLWNIDPQTREIPEGGVPAGAVEGTTSFRKTGYGGPCPPSGTHRYFFKLYALDVMLDLPPTAHIEQLEAAMAGHVIAQAELIGLYTRK